MFIVLPDCHREACNYMSEPILLLKRQADGGNEESTYC